MQREAVFQRGFLLSLSERSSHAWLDGEGPGGSSLLWGLHGHRMLGISVLHSEKTD